MIKLNFNLFIAIQLQQKEKKIKLIIIQKHKLYTLLRHTLILVKNNKKKN